MDPPPPPPNSPPTAGFSYGCTDVTCLFTDTSTDSDGSLAAWWWDFGDGSATNAPNPTHVFASGGVYLVSLTVTDDGGLTDVVQQSITVTATSGLTEDEITEMMADATDFAVSRREDEAAEKVRQEAETLIAEIERVALRGDVGLDDSNRGLEASGNRRGCIIATIADDDDLQLPLLRGLEHRRQGLRDQRLLVVGRDYDRDHHLCAWPNEDRRPGSRAIYRPD